MADAYKVLGQSDPSAATLTDAYTVPASTEAVISSIIVANRSGTGTSFRLNIAIAGAVAANEQYIAYDTAIGGNETKSFTLGITLAATDKVRVYATLATLSFNIFGVEKS